MKHLIVAALIVAATLTTPAAAQAMPSHCPYTATQAYRLIAATGQYLPRYRCAIGEEDSHRVQRALWEYARSHR